MNSQLENENLSCSYSNKELIAACGLYCGSCGIHLATQENDTEKLLMYAIVLNQSLSETLCDGCRAEHKSAHCAHMCTFIKCTFEKGIDFCGACPEFPCKELLTFQSKMPHRVEILKSQNRLKEVGWEQWLIQMKENYSCPRCDTINSSYHLTCRKCGEMPSCKFVSEHKDGIEKYLTE